MKVFNLTALVLTFSFACSSLDAQEKGSQPKQLTTFSSASLSLKETVFTGTYPVPSTITVNVVKEMVVDGKKLNVTVAEAVTVYKNIIYSFSIKNARATTLNGQVISEAELPEKVKGAKKVVVFPTLETPSPEKLKTFEEGTVLIELRERRVINER